MNALVHSLAAMSGLRDRDALDAALVRLLISSSEGGVHSAALVRVVGEGDDRRCLVQARLAAGQTQISRDLLWTDWTTLPHLSDFRLRQQAMALGQVLQGQNPDLGHTPDTSCTCVMPLSTPQGTWGLLDMEAPQPLSAHTLELVQGLVLHYNNLLGLLDYGEKDALTELLNRKTFDGAFFKATAEQHGDALPDGGERRHTHPDAGVWLAVLDIDHFKHVNDTFGHLIGDEVLLLLARLMRTSFRLHDQLYRFGGEEFVILMRSDSAEHAHTALERLRERVQAYAFPQVGTITVSMGYSVLLPLDTPSDAFGRADKAVYYAKEHGRNQVCSYQALVAAGHLVDQVAEGMDVDLF